VGLTDPEARPPIDRSKEGDNDGSDGIAQHCIKGEVHGAYDELLKDADVLQHYAYNTLLEPIEKERTRLAALRKELGIKQ